MAVALHTPWKSGLHIVQLCPCAFGVMVCDTTTKLVAMQRHQRCAEWQGCCRAVCFLHGVGRHAYFICEPYDVRALPMHVVSVLVDCLTLSLEGVCAAYRRSASPVMHACVSACWLSPLLPANTSCMLRALLLPYLCLSYQPLRG